MVNLETKAQNYVFSINFPIFLKDFFDRNMKIVFFMAKKVK